MRKQKPSKQVLSYVMNDMQMKVDLPRYLTEIAQCSLATPYRKTFDILRECLIVLTKRATEIHDPALDIIMLKLGLYEGSHDKDVQKVIDQLKAKIK